MCIISNRMALCCAIVLCCIRIVSKCIVSYCVVLLNYLVLYKLVCRVCVDHRVGFITESRVTAKGRER